jgi:hypothetical protein
MPLSDRRHQTDERFTLDDLQGKVVVDDEFNDSSLETNLLQVRQLEGYHPPVLVHYCPMECLTLNDLKGKVVVDNEFNDSSLEPNLLQLCQLEG